jgi:hypothetical protein
MPANAPACRGVFRFGNVHREKTKSGKGSQALRTFFRGTLEPKPAEWLDGTIGLGSMSLILLHHPLFHLDL